MKGWVSEDRMEIDRPTFLPAAEEPSGEEIYREHHQDHSVLMSPITPDDTPSPKRSYDRFQYMAQ